MIRAGFSAQSDLRLRMDRGGPTYRFGISGSAPRFARYENVARIGYEQVCSHHPSLGEIPLISWIYEQQRNPRQLAAKTW